MRSYHIRQAIAVAVLSIAATVMVLEFYGYINHPRKSEDELTRFHAILPVAGGQYRMSNKISPHSVQCKQGFATVITDDGERGFIQSLLVDSQERGLRCEPGPGAPGLGE